MAEGCQTVRILTLSWEYPPIVEGGLGTLVESRRRRVRAAAT